MRDRRAEDDGLAVVRLFLPMPDNGVVDGCAVHDAPDLSHVEVVARLFDLGEFIAHPDIENEGAWRHEVTAADQFSQPDLVGDIGEYRAQALAIPTIGRGGDAVDAARRVAFQGPVDDTPIAVRGGVMRLVDDQQVQCRHLIEVGRSGERRHHGEGDPAIPRLGRSIDHRGGDGRIDTAEFLAVLCGEFVAMGEHRGLGIPIADHPADHRRQHDRLTRSGWGHTERIAMLVERPEAALDELLLAGAEQHRRYLSEPRSGGRCSRATRAAGPTSLPEAHRPVSEPPSAGYPRPRHSPCGRA